MHGYLPGSGRGRRKSAVLDLNSNAAESLASRIRSSGAEAIGVGCNALEKASLESAAFKCLLPTNTLTY